MPRKPKNESPDVVWTAQALADLDLIHTFLSTKSAKSADKIIQSILSRTRQLRQFPESGKVQQTQRADTYRYLVEGNYKIIYSYRGQTVYVHTVLTPARLRTN